MRRIFSRTGRNFDHQEAILRRCQHHYWSPMRPVRINLTSETQFCPDTANMIRTGRNIEHREAILQRCQRHKWPPTRPVRMFVTTKMPPQSGPERGQLGAIFLRTGRNIEHQEAILRRCQHHHWPPMRPVRINLASETQFCPDTANLIRTGRNIEH